MFDFNLQLFAEGETTDVSTATTTNENVAGAAQESQPESLYLVTDPRTGRKSISSAKPEPTESAETRRTGGHRAGCRKDRTAHPYGTVHAG